MLPDQSQQARRISTEVKLLLLLAFSLVLLPTVTLSRGGMGFRLDDFLALVVFPVILLVRGSFNNCGVSSQTVVLMLALLFPVILLSNLLGDYGALSGLNHVMRTLKYLSVFVFAIHVFCFPGALALFTRVCAGLFILLAILSLSQFVDFLSLNSFYVPLIAPTQYITLVDDYPWPRSVGMSGGPNELGALAALGAVFLLWNYLLRGGVLLSLSFIAAVACVYFSGSRTSLIALLIGCVLPLLFVGRRFFQLDVRSLSCIALLVCAQIFLLDYLAIENLGRYADLLNVREAESLTVRFSVWRHFYDEFGISFLGHGAMTGVANSSMDSEYVLFLMRYGWVGFTWLLVFFLTCSFFYRSALALVGGLSIGLGAFTVMLTSVTFHSHIIMPFTLVIFAYFFAFDRGLDAGRMRRT